MNIQNIKKMKAEKGFTIVELLIVIVVIGILAAIVIVAYQGVTARAKTSKAQAAASTVVKKAEAYNADGPTSAYPTTLSAMTSAASTTTYYVSGIALQASSNFTAGTPPASESTVAIASCTGGGYRVIYYDYGTNAPSTAAASMHYGGASSSSTCSTFLAS